MAFKHSTNKLFTTKYGEPYLWGSGDVTTIPSNENKITASDGAANDNFGKSVAVNNGRIVIGAYGDNSYQGSAYIFNLSGTELTKITASDGAAGDYFGTSVAVGNGRIVIGAYGDNSYQGSAYIFNLSGTELTKITASDGVASDQFGRSVAIGNGRIVVGAWGDNSQQGSAYIFDLNGTQLAKITASDGAANDYFGYSVAIGNGRIVVGAYGDDNNGSNSGSAYIFDLDGTQLAKITTSDGAANDNFGKSVAVNNGRIVIGASNDDTTGSAYIFDLNGTQLSKITASDGAANDQFGISVAVGNGRIVVGARGDDVGANSNQGSAYIFDLDGTQLAKITASDGQAFDIFGNSVAIGNGRIVVGANEDNNNGSTSGSAYIFDLDGTQLAKITASDGAADDQFGYSVAVNNGRIVVGASGDDDNGSSSGSAYIYETPRVYTPYDLIYNEV